MRLSLKKIKEKGNRKSGRFSVQKSEEYKTRVSLQCQRKDIEGKERLCMYVDNVKFKKFLPQSVSNGG